MGETSLPTTEAKLILPDIRTPELFLSTDDWGERSGLTKLQFLILWYSSFDEYDFGAEAHNFEHGTACLWLANSIADAYDATVTPDKKINRKVLNAAALLHDSGKNSKYNKQKLKDKNLTKEAFSASVAAEVLPSCGYTPEEIEEVKAIILSTAQDGIVDTPEKKIMGIVDLYNVGDDESVFEARTDDFIAEAKREAGDSRDLREIMANIITKLGMNLLKDLSLPGMNEEWYLRTRVNFESMVNRFARMEPESLNLALRSVGGTALRSLLPSKFFASEKDESVQKSKD